ncbi:AI-2E family transporter [Dermacoccus nishinomiyaensis]|uniref:AI-2E family transporter n=1 Tax=Dermacoccus nishinomiyaensis TaxID=1274 RepID=UPI001ED8CF8E|nr:AI-2E family transporter [Dermacoccus nishinomiyaensis]
MVSVCLLAIASGARVLLGVTRLGVVTVSFVTGVMFAALLAPIVSWLVRRGVGRTTSAVIAFFVGVGSAAGLIAFVVAQIDDSSGEFARQLTLAEQARGTGSSTGR